MQEKNRRWDQQTTAIERTKQWKRLGDAGALKDKKEGGCGGQVNEKIKDVEGDRMRQNRCTERLK